MPVTINKTIDISDIDAEVAVHTLERIIRWIQEHDNTNTVPYDAKYTLSINISINIDDD